MFKNLFKLGKTDNYSSLKDFIHKNKKLAGIEQKFLKLSEEKRDSLVFEIWDYLSENEQQNLVLLLFFENWEKLINIYPNLNEDQKITTLEILGYISKKEVVDFLVKEMMSKKENISLTASKALKKQDIGLTLEPMLKALTCPERWLPSRVFEVLNGVGSKLVPALIDLIDKVDVRVQQVIIQIIGELGDGSCLPVLKRFINTSNPDLRKRVIEALKQLSIRESWPLLVKLLEDEEWQIRMMAAETLGILKIKESIPFLEERRLVEKDSIVKEVIEEAIQVIEEAFVPIINNWIREN